MKCRVCGNDVTDVSKCPVCGFPVIHGLEREDEENLTRMAEEYLMGQVEFYLTAHTYEEADNSIRESGQPKIKIGDGRDLSKGKILWNEQEFARIEGRRELSLEITIRAFGKDRSVRKIRVKAPSLRDFWHIGICLEGTGKVKFAVGNDSIYELSDAVSLL